MKKLLTLCAAILMFGNVHSQHNYIDSIPSGNSVIELPPADHWRVVLPGSKYNRAVAELIMAEGCYLQLAASKKESQALRNQIEELQKENAALSSADSLSSEIEENEKILTRKEKRRQWFKKAKKDIVAGALGVVAAAQAAFIVVREVER